MRELQPDEQAVVAPMSGDVRTDEFGAQTRDVVDGRVVEDELAWVGTPVVPHGDCFATPDELGAALAEPPPAAANELRGSSVALGVPPLHREDREPVSHGVRAGRAVHEGERRGEGSAG